MKSLRQGPSSTSGTLNGLRRVNGRTFPIMIFTVFQWDSLQKGDFHIGAAPIGPTELGRNAEYVFALPARYNYAFPPGFEEVEDILEGNPLQAGETIDPGNG